MTARTAESHAVAAAADADVGDGVAVSVHRNEPVGLLAKRGRKERLDPSQITEPLLADCTDERDRALVCTLRRFSARATASTTASPRQSSPMPGPRSQLLSRVTLTGTSGGNTVSRCALRTRCGFAFRPAPLSQHIARAIDADVGQSGGPHRLRVGGRPRRFAERGRRNLAQANLIADGVLLGASNKIERPRAPDGSAASPPTPPSAPFRALRARSNSQRRTTKTHSQRDDEVIVVRSLPPPASNTLESDPTRVRLEHACTQMAHAYSAVARQFEFDLHGYFVESAR